MLNFTLSLVNPVANHVLKGLIRLKSYTSKVHRFAGDYYLICLEMEFNSEIGHYEFQIVIYKLFFFEITVLYLLKGNIKSFCLNFVIPHVR